MSHADEPILTLEPLLEAVRGGLESVDWTLSGLQKTTSHEFEGRWKGDSTRSAYLFFHRDDREEPMSIDVYLDETSRGLTGNLALAVDLAELGALGGTADLLAELQSLAARHLPTGYRTPVTLRFRVPGVDSPAETAGGEVRFKLVLPQAALKAGRGAVEALASTTAAAFEALLHEGRLQAVMHRD